MDKRKNRLLVIVLMVAVLISLACRSSVSATTNSPPCTVTGTVCCNIGSSLTAIEKFPAVVANENIAAQATKPLVVVKANVSYGVTTTIINPAQKTVPQTADAQNTETAYANDIVADFADSFSFQEASANTNLNMANASCVTDLNGAVAMVLLKNSTTIVTTGPATWATNIEQVDAQLTRDANIFTAPKARPPSIVNRMNGQVTQQARPPATWNYDAGIVQYAVNSDNSPTMQAAMRMDDAIVGQSGNYPNPYLTVYNVTGQHIPQALTNCPKECDNYPNPFNVISNGTMDDATMYGYRTIANGAGAQTEQSLRIDEATDCLATTRTCYPNLIAA